MFTRTCPRSYVQDSVSRTHRVRCRITSNPQKDGMFQIASERMGVMGGAWKFRSFLPDIHRVRTCVREQNVRDSVSRTLFETDSVIIFSSSENSCTKYIFFVKTVTKKEKKSFFSRPRKFSVSAHPESATPVVGRRPIGPIERVYLKTFPPHHHLCMRLRLSRYIHP